ncbi:MAG: glutathione S-transferase family protein [Pseudomonadota bacterium]
MSVVLYHFPRSLSSAAVQVIDELQADIVVRVLDFDRGQFQSTEESLRLPTGGMGLIGPVRSCPTFCDKEKGLELIQCSAIIEHLCDRFDSQHVLRPAPGTLDHARHLSLMVFAEATLFPIVQFLTPPGSPHDNTREAMRRARFCGLAAPYLIQQLAGRPYFGGDRAAAVDFLITMPCLNNANNAGVLEPFPELQAYFERTSARPSFARARGDPSDAALNAALSDMVTTAHRNGWDFEFRSTAEN